MKIVSPYLMFGSIGWWLHAVNATSVLFEKYEHFQKMSDRNRYTISGANNSILLTAPLANGRNQDTPIADVRIQNDDKWQVQHWRTLTSVYNRSPYFFHYADSLGKLYDTPFVQLTDFNNAAMQWVKAQLKLGFEEAETTGYQKIYSADHTDLRGFRSIAVVHSRYYQVFEDRIGFMPNLCILDLLFSEGPHTGAWLRANQPVVLAGTGKGGVIKG